MAETVEEIESIIQLLNGGNSSQANEANALLMQFVETEVAWVWCLTLLRSKDQFVEYFAANMLLTKARKHWGQLTEQQQEEVYQQVAAFLQEYVSTVAGASTSASLTTPTGDTQALSFVKTFTNRVALVFAVICCQYECHNLTPSSPSLTNGGGGGSATRGLEAFVRIGTELLMQNTQQQQQLQNGEIQLPFPGTLIISLELLAVLPSVVDDADVSRAAKLQLNDHLIHFSSHLYACLEGVLQSRNNAFHTHEIISLLRVIRTWGSASGITLSHLSGTHQGLYSFLLSCVHSATTPQVLSEGSLCLQALVNVSEYPRPLNRSAAVALLMQAWAGDDSQGVGVGVGAFNNPSLQYLLAHTDIDETAANSVCQSIISVGFCELDYIVSAEGFSSTFTSLLLSLTALRPRVISLHTFEFWIAMEDSDPSCRHQYFQQEVFRVLTQVMLNQLLHPKEKKEDDDEESESLSGWGVGVGVGVDGGGVESESDEGGEDEDIDDLMEFRKDDQGIQDVFKQCIDSLGSEAFFLLLDTYTQRAFVLFEGTHSSSSGGAVNGEMGGEGVVAVGPADWRSLDVVMYVLVSVTDVRRRDAIHAGSQAVATAPASMKLLLKLLQYVLSPIRAQSTAARETNQSHGQLYAQLPSSFLFSCCQLLGATTFLLTPPCANQFSLLPPSQVPPLLLSPFQELFAYAVEFIFCCLSQSVVQGGGGVGGACRSRVAHSAAEALLRLSTHGIHNIVDQRDASAEMSQLMRGIATATAELLAPPPNTAGAGRPVPLKSMLLVLQSVTVVVSSCPSPQHRADLLSMLVNPLIVQLEINLAATSWSAAEFIRTLKLLSQIIRYVSPWSVSGEAASADEMSYIVEFLGAMWPLLDQIASLMSTSEASIGNPVLDCVFAIYKNAVTNMPTLLAQQPGVVAEMAQRGIATFFSLQNSEAIDCVAGMVEAFPTSATSSPVEDNFVLLGQVLLHAIKGMEMGQKGFLEAVLRELLGASTSTAVSGGGGEARQSLARVKERVRQEWRFGDEPESMEHYFNFIYQYFLCSPHIVLHLASQSQSPTQGQDKSDISITNTSCIVDDLMQLLLVSLYMFNERDTIRKILSILQAILIPVVGGDALDAQKHDALVMIPSLRYAEILLQLIFHLLDPVDEGGGGDISSSSNGTQADGCGSTGGQQALQTGILPSLAETFYSLLVVCDEHNIPGVVEWLSSKLAPQAEVPSYSIAPLVLPSIAENAPERPVLFSALLRFAHNRTSRKFKALITDVHKVCNGEMDVMALRDYCV